jgi:hypothetical protein
VPITEGISWYTYASAPFDFPITETPTHITIEISMAQEGSTPHFGSKLFIDDIVVNSAQLSVINHQDNVFAIWPTHTKTNINVNLSAQEPAVLQISDTSGKTVGNYNMSGQALNIDVSGFATGIYFLKASTGNSTITRKFIKE